jgi:hypothetical protein
MIEKIKKFREYLDYIEEHYNNVQKAWSLINEKCKDKSFRFMYDDFVWGTIDAEVKAHDLSKLSEQEFTQYRQWFFPCESETKDKALFDSAWEHHKLMNEHHWQNWTVKHTKSPYADAFLIMNIVDWVAMGIKFNDTAKDYYEKNKKDIDLPQWAVELMYKVFDCIYPN